MVQHLDLDMFQSVVSLINVYISIIIVLLTQL